MKESIEFFNEKLDDLKVSASLVKGIVLMTVTGQVNTYNSTHFFKMYEKIIDADKSKVLVVDIAGLNYISSTGVGIFASMYKTCYKRSIELHILNMDAKIRKVFDLLGFSSFFHFISRFEDAI
jgi:anti-sigma B factor antagonist